MTKLTRQELMRCLVVEHEILSVADFAEQIVAEALDGQRGSNGVLKGYDLLAPAYGRVEVKFRQLPNDGRLEERVALSDAKEGEFDYLAIVIFQADFSIKGAVLVPFMKLGHSSNQVHTIASVTHKHVCAKMQST